jgi:hypothetical protein
MDRETKTAAELEALIMEQAGERADCADVRAVAVRSTEIGWRVVAILRDGRMMNVKAIDDIANELRAKYDISPEMKP